MKGGWVDAETDVVLTSWPVMPSMTTDSDRARIPHLRDNSPSLPSAFRRWFPIRSTGPNRNSAQRPEDRAGRTLRNGWNDYAGWRKKRGESPPY